MSPGDVGAMLVIIMYCFYVFPWWGLGGMEGVREGGGRTLMLFILRIEHGVERKKE